MKVISVPLSAEAMERLDTDSCVEGDLKELELDSKGYEQLWGSGVFDKLNNCLGVIIDDFEDEMIPYEKLTKAIEVVETSAPKDCDYSEPLLCLMKLAQKNHTGIFFYF
jgi:hypothetical protein